jgi:hypothetical protein
LSGRTAEFERYLSDEQFGDPEMRIYRLGPGRLAPEQADYIHINNFEDGRCGWTGCVGTNPDRVTGASRNSHPTVDEAVSEGIDWARACRSTDLYVECDEP